MRVVKRFLGASLTGLTFGTGSRLSMSTALVCAAMLQTAPNPAEARNDRTYRLEAIQVEGNKRIDTATVLNYANLPLNTMTSTAEMNRAYRRVVGSGLFEKVEMVPYPGGRLLIKVTEFPTINKVAFEGNKRIKDKDLAGFIESSSRQVYSPAKAERDAQIIAEAYEQNGRISARVNPKIIRRSENRVDLVFEIFEGKKVEVQRIGFVGNRNYSDRRLRRVISSKQAGFFRALVNKDTFVEDRVEFDKQLLTDFYNSRGYVDFRITGVNAELSQTQDTYFLTFNMQEGQQFRFGEISIVSERSDVDPEQYEAALRIPPFFRVKPGLIYSPTVVEEVITRMERLALREGVDFMRVEPRINRNERDQTLDVEFALTRGPRVFVERIDIEGNTTTLDRVVRRQFDMAEGDPFNPRSIRAAADRIRALNYFDNVDVNANEGTRDDQVVVHVDVEEKATGSVSFGASYGTNGGLGVTLGFTERNFLGRGQTIAAQVSTSSDVNQYAFNFVEPAFLGRDVAFGLDLRYYDTDSDNSRYDTTNGVFRPSLEFPVSQNGRLNVYYDFEYQNMKNYQGGSGILEYETARGHDTISALGYQYNFDTRRTGLNPNTGVLLTFGQRFAGLGGDLDFIETTASAIAQTRVWSEEITLRATLEGGAFHTWGDDILAINRYGHQVIRGFEPNGIGPTENDEHLGGKYFAALKLEALFPLGLPDEYGISGGAFYDIGSIWKISDKNAVHPVHSRSFKTRHAAGLSLFWKSPFGPLRFNYSKAIKKERTDNVQNFEMTVSTEF